MNRCSCERILISICVHVNKAAGVALATLSAGVTLKQGWADLGGKLVVAIEFWQLIPRDRLQLAPWLGTGKFANRTGSELS